MAEKEEGVEATVRTILEGTVASLIWNSLVGDSLLIAVGDGRLHAATLPEFTPRDVRSLSEAIDQAIWTP